MSFWAGNRQPDLATLSVCLSVCLSMTHITHERSNLIYNLLCNCLTYGVIPSVTLLKYKREKERKGSSSRVQALYSCNFPWDKKGMQGLVKENKAEGKIILVILFIF